MTMKTTESRRETMGDEMASSQALRPVALVSGVHEKTFGNLHTAEVPHLSSSACWGSIY